MDNPNIGNGSNPGKPSRSSFVSALLSGLLNAATIEYMKSQIASDAAKASEPSKPDESPDAWAGLAVARQARGDETFKTTIALLGGTARPSEMAEFTAFALEQLASEDKELFIRWYVNDGKLEPVGEKTPMYQGGIVVNHTDNEPALLTVAVIWYPLTVALDVSDDDDSPAEDDDAGMSYGKPYPAFVGNPEQDNRSYALHGTETGRMSVNETIDGVSTGELDIDVDGELIASVGYPMGLGHAYAIETIQSGGITRQTVKPVSHSVAFHDDNEDGSGGYTVIYSDDVANADDAE